jgi:hypothetical protein
MQRHLAPRTSRRVHSPRAHARVVGLMSGLTLSLVLASDLVHG